MTLPPPLTPRAQRLCARVAAKSIELESTRIELESIIRDAWTEHEKSGSERDAEIARLIEGGARELLASLPAMPLRPKLKTSKKAKKRKAFKRCVRLDASAPILAQVRELVR